MKNSWRIILFWCNVLRVIRRGINFKEEKKKEEKTGRGTSFDEANLIKQI